MKETLRHMKFNVVEIFKSIDGEGPNSGMISTFIRLAECNLRCSYCDTKYSYCKKDSQLMTLEEIIKKVQVLNSQNITLTGGEPLLWEGAPKLVKELDRNGYSVSIETNGSIILPTKHLPATYIIDFKSPSSGMNKKMILSNYFTKLQCGDVIKCVVGNKKDLDTAHALYTTLEKEHIGIQMYFSPVWGEIEPKEIVEYLIENNMHKARLQLQLHKIIWPPEMRGV